jgi:hypothetical protein
MLSRELIVCMIAVMAIGKQKRERQETLWIPTGEIPAPPAHPFYRRLNTILTQNGFDDFVERMCAKFYAAKMGSPSLIPEIYFRLLMIGYFEGLDCVRMFRSPNNGVGDGAVTKKRKRLFMEIEGESAGSEEKRCFGDGENFWSGLLLIFMKPGECVAYTCEVVQIFSNEF